jgi:hypothetical protein
VRERSEGEKGGREGKEGREGGNGRRKGKVGEGRFSFVINPLICTNRYPAIWDAVQSQLAATYLILGLRTGATPDLGQADPDQAKQACEHLLRALKMYDALKDTYQVAITHLHLASLYGRMIR